MTVKEARRFAATYLAQRNLLSPREDAELILLSVLECDRTFLLSRPEQMLSIPQERVFHQWLRKRGEHYPLQYLRGTQEFYGREFLVTPAVLIPRPETELVVETSLSLLQGCDEDEVYVLEVGTGSGCIAVTLACEDPRIMTTATEISATALSCARRNAEKHACLHRIEFLLGDAARPVVNRGPHYHLLVSNPPYVGRLREHEVEISVARYEPREAVFAGELGLDVYRGLLSDGKAVLRPDGCLVVELGHDIGGPVRSLGRAQGWVRSELLKDLSGVDRCAIFRVQ